MIVMLGVRLNKPYSHKGQLDLPSFNGNHADLLFLVRVVICIKLLECKSGAGSSQDYYQWVATVTAIV